MKVTDGSLYHLSEVRFCFVSIFGDMYLPNGHCRADRNIGIRYNLYKKRGIKPMDPIKYGAFIASLRKKAGLTQQEVAAYLGIANKTVSKRECAGGYPDITLLPAIGELYSITVDELLACKKNSEACDATITKPQDTQIFHQAQARSCAIFNIVSIGFCLSLVTSLLFFILEIYLFITALCVISIIIARVAYRKALHFFQGIHSENQYVGDVKNFFRFCIIVFCSYFIGCVRLCSGHALLFVDEGA